MESIRSPDPRSSRKLLSRGHILTKETEACSSLSHCHKNMLLFPLCCACFLLPHLCNSYETHLHSLYTPELLTAGLRLLHNVITHKGKLTPPSLVSMELVTGPLFPFLAIWVHEFLFGTPQLFISPVHTPVFLPPALSPHLNSSYQLGDSIPPYLCTIKLRDPKLPTMCSSHCLLVSANGNFPFAQVKSLLISDFLTQSS